MRSIEIALPDMLTERVLDTCAADVKSAQPWLLEDRGLVCCLEGREENLCQLSRERSDPLSAQLSTAKVYEAKQSQR